MMKSLSSAAASLPPPAFYEGSLSYEHQWKQYKESLETRDNAAVMDVAFYPAAPVFSEYLLACTSSGLLCVWKLPPLQFPSQAREAVEGEGVIEEDEEEGEHDEDDGKTYIERLEQLRRSGHNKPIGRFLIAPPPLNRLYTIRIAPIQDRTLVLVGGDVGVVVLDWHRDLLPAISQAQPGQQKDLAAITSSMQAPQFRPYPSPTEPAGSVEINDIYLDTSRGHLYGAAGDAFGCYKWDLESNKLITTYPSPGNGYLHCIGPVPGGSISSSHVILTGGEDGILGIWDTRLDRSMDQIDLNIMLASSNATATNTHRSPALPRSNATGTKGGVRPCWISSFVARDENWWTVSGGYFPKSVKATTSSPHGNRGCGGFLCTWHGPTRSLVAHVDRYERPQRLAQFEDRVVSVANESWVSHWDLFSLERITRVRCNPVLSGYGLTVDHDGRVAVSGVGSSILLYERGTLQTGRLDL